MMEVAKALQAAGIACAKGLRQESMGLNELVGLDHRGWSRQEPDDASLGKEERIREFQPPPLTPMYLPSRSE